MSNPIPIGGECVAGFEAVRDAFVRNFTDRDEVGAAVAVWVDGDLAVNLWGVTPMRTAAGAGGRTPWPACSPDQGSDQHLRAPARRPRRARPGRAGGRLLAGIRLPRQAEHHHRLRARPPLRRHRAARSAALNDTTDWTRVCDELAAATPWWTPGTAQATTWSASLHSRRGRPPGHRRSIGQYLRTEIAEPMGIDVHIGLPPAEHHRCADMINKPHIRDVLAKGQAPSDPTAIDEHPMAGLSITMGFVPDDELGPTS